MLIFILRLRKLVTFLGKKYTQIFLFLLNTKNMEIFALYILDTCKKRSSNSNAPMNVKKKINNGKSRIKNCIKNISHKFSRKLLQNYRNSRKIPDKLLKFRKIQRENSLMFLNVNLEKNATKKI